MTKILIYILAFATLTSPLLAQTPPNTSIKQFPPQSTVVESVLVPVPREIFNTLDKFANSNWRAVQRPELAQWRPHSDQAETALLLGVVIAEGFIAVEAEDAGEAKSIAVPCSHWREGWGSKRRRSGAATASLRPPKRVTGAQFGKNGMVCFPTFSRA